MNIKISAKIIRWAGRIIALPVIAFFLLFRLGYFLETLTIQGWQSAISSAIGNIYDLLGIVATVLTLIGIIVSWWWLLQAGILLIFAYLLEVSSSILGAVYHVGYFNWSQFRVIWSMPSIIYLFVGILFILSWWLSRKVTNSGVGTK